MILVIYPAANVRRYVKYMYTFIDEVLHILSACAPLNKVGHEMSDKDFNMW